MQYVYLFIRVNLPEFSTLTKVTVILSHGAFSVFIASYLLSPIHSQHRANTHCHCYHSLLGLMCTKFTSAQTEACYTVRHFLPETAADRKLLQRRPTTIDVLVTGRRKVYRR